MTDRQHIARKMHDHYQAVWQQGDAWDFETSDFERQRYALLLSLLADRRYERALEIGCGSGCFTRQLAGISDRVVALDVAPAAIDRARMRTVGAGPGSVDLRVANIMEWDPLADGPWDLIVLSETVYCLGWLYPMFDVAWMTAQLLDATRPGGRCLLTNTFGKEKDWLLRPWLIYTYRDLFRNIGYRLEREEVFRGCKDGVEFDVLISLFVKPDEPA